jgi:methoxymalonate biosynthesis acyl carrier protein
VTDTAGRHGTAGQDEDLGEDLGQGWVEQSLLRFLQERTQLSWKRDQDLFAAGGVSSLFALQLVLYLEQEFGVAVSGPDLKLDNFRTVRSMAELVRRLSGPQLGEPKVDGPQ